MLKPNPQLGGIEDAVYANIDPDSNKVIAMMYRIKDLGVFIRRNRGWEYPTSEDAFQLQDTMVETIERSKANELVERFDASAEDLLDLRDLNDYISEESE